MIKEERFENNQKLVYFVFNQYYKRLKMYKDDLLQCGMVGLWKACLNFDENLNYKFSNFAIKCIKNEMRVFLRSEIKHVENLSLEEIENCVPCYELENKVEIPKDLDKNEKILIEMISQGHAFVDAKKTLGKNHKQSINRLKRRIKN